MTAFAPSPTLEAFLHAEVRNIANGGDDPVTLDSARDSLVQMPQDVLDGLNPDIGAIGADRNGLLLEIRTLASLHGGGFAVEDALGGRP